MKPSIGNFSLFIIFALFFSGFADGQKKSAKKDLPNFYRVDANLYRGGQPTETGVKQLAGKVKTIVYLRGADGKAKTEEAWAKAARIDFKNFPLNNWFEPKNSQVKAILTFIEDPKNQPVIVHCQRGADRTGTIVAVYRISHDNWTAKQAIDEAKKFDFGWWQFWMRDYINDYYRDFKKQK